MLKLLSIAATAALLAAASVGTPALAAKKPMNKMCMAADNAGKKVSFKCGAAEKCCWQPLIQKGSCVPATGICL